MALSPLPISSRTARSSRLLTSVAEARRVSQASRFDSPHFGDHPGDVVLVFGRFAVAHRAGEHRVDELLDVIDLTGRGGVGEDVGARHGLGQQRIALHRAVEFADHEVQPLVGRAAGQRGAVGLGVDSLELPAQRRDQQMHLRREIPVERAHRDVRAVGDRAHLNCLVAALRGDGHRRVQDALATLALRLRAELGLGQVPPRSSPHEAAQWTRSRVARVGVRWRTTSDGQLLFLRPRSKRYACRARISHLRAAGTLRCPAAMAFDLTVDRWHY